MVPKLQVSIIKTAFEDKKFEWWKKSLREQLTVTSVSMKELQFAGEEFVITDEPC